jgi:hypothetical protein
MHEHALLIVFFKCRLNILRLPECKHQTLIWCRLKYWPFHSMDYHHYPFTICWSSFFGRSYCHVTKIGHDDGFPYFSHRYVGYYVLLFLHIWDKHPLDIVDISRPSEQLELQPGVAAVAAATLPLSHGSTRAGTGDSPSPGARLCHGANVRIDADRLGDRSHQQMMDKYYIIGYGYGSIPIDTFLVGWTSIYQLFWCSPGVQGFDTLPHN